MKIKLEQIMHEKNISMYKMSNDTGIAQSTISKLYNQKTTRIDFNTLKTICHYLNCTPSDLFDIEEND